MELYDHQYDIEDQLDKDKFSAELKARGLPGIFDLSVSKNKMDRSNSANSTGMGKQY